MFNFKIEKPYLEKEPKKDLLQTTNEMQVRLAVRHLGYESNDGIIEWMDEHDLEFRRIIDAHPEYVDEYEGDSESVLDKIAEEIYKGEEVEKR